MSTFDTMCDWRDGIISDGEALSVLVVNLAEWHPSVKGVESYEAICEVMIALCRKEAAEGEKRLVQAGVVKCSHPQHGKRRICPGCGGRTA